MIFSGVVFVRQSSDLTIFSGVDFVRKFRDLKISVV